MLRRGGYCKTTPRGRSKIRSLGRLVEKSWKRRTIDSETKGKAWGGTKIQTGNFQAEIHHLKLKIGYGGGADPNVKSVYYPFRLWGGGGLGEVGR